MTGPEHYGEAERLLDWVAEQEFTPAAAENTFRSQVLSAAQVHATLALAAATVLPALGGEEPLPYRSDAAWRQAIAQQVTRCVSCGSLATAPVCEDCGADPTRVRVAAEL